MSKEGLKFKFKELKVWQKGKDLAVYIYRISNSGDFAKDYGLRDIPKETFKEIEKGCIEMSSMLSKLIAAETTEHTEGKNSVLSVYSVAKNTLYIQ